VKPSLKTILVLVATFSSIRVVRAQEVNAYLGFGSAYDTSNGAQIETFSDGSLYKTPSMGGFFGHIGAGVFITKRLGLGTDISWRFPQGDYAGIQYRPTFYNFDAIYQPLKGRTNRFAPEFRAGIGGAHVHFFTDDDQACAQVPGCQASNHFQWHLAVATRWYVTDHLFFRPILDVHYVNNFFEFGRNWVPEYSLGIGYSLGKSQ